MPVQSDDHFRSIMRYSMHFLQNITFTFALRHQVMTNIVVKGVLQFHINLKIYVEFSFFDIILQSVELTSEAIEFLNGIFRLLDTDKVCNNIFSTTAMCFKHRHLGGFHAQYTFCSLIFGNFYTF